MDMDSERDGREHDQWYNSFNSGQRLVQGAFHAASSDAEALVPLVRKLGKRENRGTRNQNWTKLQSITRN